MNELLKEALDNSMTSTMAEMGFIDTIPDKSGNLTLKDIESPMAVKLGILLPFLGDMIIVAPHSVCKLFISNIYTEPIDPQDQDILKDTLAEIINIVCGKLFQIAAPDVLFELGLPEIIDPDGLDLKDYTIQFYKTAQDEHICMAHKVDKMWKLPA